MMTDESKEIWNSPEGASLMNAALGLKPMSKEDWATAQRLKDIPKTDPVLISTPPDTPPESKT